MERVLIAMQAAGAKADGSVGYFVAHTGAEAARVAWGVAEELRSSGKSVVLGGGGSFKSQMKKADANGAMFTVIIGDDEVASGKVTLKDMRDGTQKTINRNELGKS
jgi:histidyl-tRNA synthetase